MNRQSDRLLVQPRRMGVSVGARSFPDYEAACVQLEREASERRMHCNLRQQQQLAGGAA